MDVWLNQRSRLTHRLRCGSRGYTWGGFLRQFGGHATNPYQLGVKRPLREFGVRLASMPRTNIDTLLSITTPALEKRTWREVVGRARSPAGHGTHGTMARAEDS